MELGGPSEGATDIINRHLDTKIASTNSWVSCMHCSEELTLFFQLNLKCISWSHSLHVKSLLVERQFPMCLLMSLNRSCFSGGEQAAQWPIRHIGKKQVYLRVKVNIQSVFKTYSSIQKRVKVERTLLFYALEKRILLLIFRMKVFSPITSWSVSHFLFSILPPRWTLPFHPLLVLNCTFLVFSQVRSSECLKDQGPFSPGSAL